MFEIKFPIVIQRRIHFKSFSIFCDWQSAGVFFPHPNGNAFCSFATCSIIFVSSINSMKPTDAYMHICVNKIIIIRSDNGLSPGRRQAIIWISAIILSIGTLKINFSEVLIEIHIFSFKKMHMKLSSARWQPFCLGLNELRVACNKISSQLTHVANP